MVCVMRVRTRRRPAIACASIVSHQAHTRTSGVRLRRKEDVDIGGFANRMMIATAGTRTFVRSRAPE